MPLEILHPPLTFCLHAGDPTYVLAIHSQLHVPLHIYWRTRLKFDDWDSLLFVTGRAYSPSALLESTPLSFDALPLEFSTFWLRRFLNPGARGLAGMSQTFHFLYRERLCRGRFRDRNRLILIKNHQVSCPTSLETRGHVAQSGVFDYELDLNQSTPAEQEEVRSQNALHKEIRPLVRTGSFWRLRNPLIGNEAAWMVVDLAKSEVIVFHFLILAVAREQEIHIRQRGLDATAIYETRDAANSWSGAFLMNAGLVFAADGGDDRSRMWQLRERRLTE